MRECEHCGAQLPSDHLTTADGLEFCDESCLESYEDEREPEDVDYGERGELDETDFSDPSGHSALRAATPDNPRNLPCPECGSPNRLTPADVACGYRCDSCADRAEMGGY